MLIVNTIMQSGAFDYTESVGSGAFVTLVIEHCLTVFFDVSHHQHSIRWMTSQIGYLKLLITRSILSGPLDFEIKRVTCNCVFCSKRIRTLVAMATYSFHWLIMGKVEIGIYCYLTVDILTKVLRKCSLSSPLWSIWILSKLLNLMATEWLNLQKNIQKSSPQKP